MRFRASTSASVSAGSGFVLRSKEWWSTRNLDDNEWRRGGAGPLNRVLLELDGRPAGYAIYRIYSHQTEWKRTLRIQEAIGLDPRATREIWRFLLGIDWMDDIQIRLLPVDHELMHLLATPRALGMKVSDGLWVRPVDVGAALSGRSYAVDGRVTLEVVSDPLFEDNVGTWTIADGGARRSSRRPDVRLDVQALGSVLPGRVLLRRARPRRARRGGSSRRHRPSGRSLPHGHRALVSGDLLTSTAETPRARRFRRRSSRARRRRRR